MCFRLRDKVWSPYVAGAIIGLLQIPVLLLVGSSLEVYPAYVTVTGNFLAAFDPLVEFDPYYNLFIGGAQNIWILVMAVGIALGAWLSARLSGMVRHGICPVWTRYRHVTTMSSRLALGFAGGFVMLIGAAIAGGETVAHGISGLAELSVGSFVTMLGVFVGGIVAARVLPKL